MAHISDRWSGIVLRIVRGYYPDAELIVWGPVVEGQRSEGDRFELVLIEPPSPPGDTLVEMRRDLERSDLPVPCDLRSFHDLTLNEQAEVLDRGIRIGG